jgi:hypothetical protein
MELDVESSVLNELLDVSLFNSSDSYLFAERVPGSESDTPSK